MRTLVLNNNNVVQNGQNNTLIYNFPTTATFDKSYVAVASLSMYYSWFNIASKYNNNVLSYTWTVGGTSTTYYVGGTVFPSTTPTFIPDAYKAHAWSKAVIIEPLQLNLGAEYVSADNDRQVPVMLHRAIVGSLERFIGILIENHAGAMPTWLAPTQCIVMNISGNSAEYAEKVQQILKKQGFRAEVDLRNEKITFKIREHAMQKVPYLIVVGDKEAEANAVAVRARGGVDLGVMPIEDFIARLQQDVSQKVGPQPV
jgi:threonyl-tRNA synthetase